MVEQSSIPQHIKTTETLLRLYVLLAQFLDRCQEEEGRRSSLSEAEFQKLLLETKTSVASLVSSNRIVPEKIEQEFEQIMQIGQNVSKNPGDTKLMAEVTQQREVLRIKTLALSDLLAVFRSQ